MRNSYVFMLSKELFVIQFRDKMIMSGVAVRARFAWEADYAAAAN